MARNSNIDVGGAFAEKGRFTQAIRCKKTYTAQEILIYGSNTLGIKIVILRSIYGYNCEC
jgi:hypothetical protein